MILASSILEPNLGLIFWALVIFALLYFGLTKFAWKPIIAALQEREASIDDALSLAAKTRQEMTDLKAGNEKLIAEARAERDRVLKEAKEAADTMISQAKADAQKAGAEEIEKARAAFNQEKINAVASLRKETAKLSLEIAEKVLRNQLSDPKAQESLVSSLLADAKLN
jgi:F-type H+-transporting ATPase subunit b